MACSHHTTDKYNVDMLSVQSARSYPKMRTYQQCSLLTITALLVAAATALQKDYTGYRVVEVLPKNHKQVSLLHSIAEISEVSFWSGPDGPGKKSTFSVAPGIYKDIKEELENVHLEPIVINDNIQKQIDIERELNQKGKSLEFDIFKYNRHEDINNYLEKLGQSCAFCEVISIGKSHEGRDMKLIKIGGQNTKLKMFIDAGIHAREWIAPATALYIIDKLVNGYDNDPSIRALVESVTWYILPVLNPDGYEYSHVEERLWRKTRSKQEPDFCTGVDANRNFDYHWMEGGASDNPCSEVFAGTKAFSEVESSNLAGFLNKTSGLSVYLALHSYGQLWLTPWGYTLNYPEDYDDLESLAKKATDAIHKTTKKTFRVGTSTRVLYVAAGGADDWAKGVAGIKYSYTVELRNKGGAGFVLPPSEIKPSGQEIFAAVSAMAQELLQQKK